MQGFLGYCFDELATHRVEALVDYRNPGSIRFTQKLGFKNEGLLRDRICVAGEYRSLLMFALLEDEWKAREHGFPRTDFATRLEQLRYT